MESLEKKLQCRADSSSFLNSNGNSAAIANRPIFPDHLKVPTFPWYSSAGLLNEDEVSTQFFAKGTIIYSPKSILKHKQ